MSRRTRGRGELARHLYREACYTPRSGSRVKKDLVKHERRETRELQERFKTRGLINFKHRRVLENCPMPIIHQQTLYNPQLVSTSCRA
jgi:hypothetical protein